MDLTLVSCTVRSVSLAVVLVVVETSAPASVITTGNVDPGGTGIQPDPWAIMGILTVDNSGTGTLNVASGGVVTNGVAYMGYGGGSTSEATVTGSGSQWNTTGSLWDNSDYLSVGRVGTGTLNVEADGLVSNTEGFIGRYFGSMGVATVTGAGSEWNNTVRLHVGHEGTGRLNVEAGGVLRLTLRPRQRYCRNDLPVCPIKIGVIASEEGI